jgi:hypothetical protein
MRLDFAEMPSPAIFMSEALDQWPDLHDIQSLNTLTIFWPDPQFEISPIAFLPATPQSYISLLGATPDCFW